MRGLIELNTIFGRSLEKILALLHKPRKSRTIDKIIAIMCDEFV